MIENLTLLHYSVIMLVLLVVIISICLIKLSKKVKIQMSLNSTDHSILMKNQNHLNTAIKKIDLKLKDDSDHLKSIKIILMQRVIPLIQKDKIVQRLTEEINRLETSQETSLQTITNLSLKLDEVNEKYKRTKEELEFAKTTVPIQKL